MPQANQMLVHPKQYTNHVSDHMWETLNMENEAQLFCI
uniref:Uncharacterized protein n=1 Tax=Anguilla anguilla TaxID=7936 RepID=A0A0E9U5X3_ANGAN